ncbi:MAG: response regulator [Cyanobacteria bacterium P01_F01_bin.42]
MQPKSKAPLAAPAKVLKKMTDERRFGKVSLYDLDDPSIGWSIYFGGGQVHYAHSIVGQGARLNYLIGQHLPQLRDVLKYDSDGGEHFDSDYRWICDRWKTHQVPLNIIRRVLTKITTEALIHTLAMPQARVELSSSIGLDPLLLSVPFRQLILPVREDIHHWVTLQPTVKSPFNRFQILNPLKWDEGLSDSEESDILRLRSSIEDGKFLYEIAQDMGQTVEELAQLVSKLIGNGLLTVDSFAKTESENQPVIACVDDSQTIQHFVKLALEPSGYDVVSLLDPTKALQALLDKKPQLILMDIEMPKIDGYELCKMVRQVEVLRKTPVVMLTGREGLIDRVRAKMLGTSAYLTKPFNPTEMLTLIQKLTKDSPVIAS